jgi:hypothetical protein
MLKHEPTEADALPMPSLGVIERAAPRLRLLHPQIAAHLRGQDISPAINIVDRVILHDLLGMTVQDVSAVRGARDVLFSRRVARARG